LGFDIDPGRRVGALAVAHQQVVEIAKALSREVKVIVFDEPTAALSAQDAGRLHRVIAGLRGAGVAVVYISHRLDKYSCGVPGSVALAVLCGAACGAATGGFVAFLGLPSFVMSLAMMAVARGLSLILSAGRPLPLGDDGDRLTGFGAGYVYGVPEPVILMFAVFLVGGVVLNFTLFGRVVTAIGSNEEAVRLSGIPAARYILAVYLISGALAALGP